MFKQIGNLKITGLAAIVAMAASITAAAADYRACMEFCLKEHGFTRCNETCAGQAGQAGQAGIAPKPAAKPVGLCELPVAGEDRWLDEWSAEDEIANRLVANPPYLLRQYFSEKEWGLMRNVLNDFTQSEDDPNLFEATADHLCTTVMVRKWGKEIGGYYDYPEKPCSTRYWRVKARFINADCDVEIVEPPECIGEARPRRGREKFPCGDRF